MKIKVELQKDHISRLVNKVPPISALSELIWNSLDGDANGVTIGFSLNDLGGWEEIAVLDNGSGITHGKAVESFGSLGGSWKRSAEKTELGRKFHGKAGEGRFNAFVLGAHVKWISQYVEDGKLQQIEIIGNSGEMGMFEVSDPKIVKTGSPGTTVTIRAIDKNLSSLLDPSLLDRLTETYALYLRTYGDVSISIQGNVLDPKAQELRTADIPITDVLLMDGSKAKIDLTVIEWKHKVERTLHLCDADGFALTQLPTKLQAPGFNFTAYLKSALFREWSDKGHLEIAEMHPDAVTLIEAGRRQIKGHFRARAAEQAKSVVEEWKAEKVYPYEGAPKGLIEQIERQVFDVVALNLNEYLPEFSDSDPKSKRFSLQMLRSAIERSPLEAQRIIQEVLDLPKEKQEELAALLDRTTLTAIINISKEIADRLDYISGLETILYDTDYRERLLERKQLHKILAPKTWLFGEEYRLTVDDRSLTEVLAKHLGLLGKDRKELAPVTTIDGEAGIVDLMLSGRIPLPSEEERNHLIIELKRPSKKLDGEDLFQLGKYALAVANDERFKGVHARWNYWLISNDMDDQLAHTLHDQGDRPDGMHRIGKNIVIWVKTWSQVLHAARSRLTFFEKALQYAATRDSGMAYLRSTHAKYLPNDIEDDLDKAMKDIVAALDDDEAEAMPGPDSNATPTRNAETSKPPAAE